MPDGSDQYLSDHLAHLGGRCRSAHRIEALRANYVDVLPANREARILEIGPGLGEFLDLAINELGYRNVEAIDTSSEVVEHCRAICRMTVHVQDSIGFLQDHPQTFERIVLLHVLEHVPKPEILPFLTAIRNALQPETGMVVVEVPNMAHPLTGSMYRYADFTHEIGFTSSSLAQVMRMTGFEAIEVRRFATPRGTPLRLLQWSAKWMIESASSLLLRVYQQQPDMVCANLVALASPRGPR
jgi:2-polyprenyl-3-methyl-5-hydroxy-6-metoxy-1,4-benzoquinol methylase